MRGVYTASYEIANVSASGTLIYLAASTSGSVEVLEVEVSNGSNETNEQLVVAWQEISALGTPTATAVTPTPHEAGDRAAKVTVAAAVTASEPTYEAGVRLGLRGFSSLGGYLWTPIPEARAYIRPGGSWGLRLLAPNTPTALNLIVSVTFREIV